MARNIAGRLLSPKPSNPATPKLPEPYEALGAFTSQALQVPLRPASSGFEPRAESFFFFFFWGGGRVRVGVLGCIEAYTRIGFRILGFRV